MRFSLASMFWAAALVGVGLSWWADHERLAYQLHWSQQSLRVAKLRVGELERTFLVQPPSEKAIVQPPQTMPYWPVTPRQPNWLGPECQAVGDPLAAALR